MPSRNFTLDNGLVIGIYKRRGNRHLRLSISPAGKVRVSIPNWVPYQAGIDFARSRQAWIAEQSAKPTLLRQGQAVGKGHHLRFVVEPGLDRVKSQVRGTDITVSYPPEFNVNHPEVQEAAQAASLRSLRTQAKHLLPQRLDSLARQHGFEYNGLQIKQLTGRWGSCDQRQRIVLSLFLMQLPWSLIDYVLLHELVHTRVLQHGPEFWRAFEAVLSDVKARKKELQTFRPVLAGMPTEVG